VALKSTIFKLELQISDLDRHYYQMHALTIARHPSETDERMMVRVIAFALQAHATLEFGKGLSTEEEPDLWRKDLTGVVDQWIEVGLPDEKRLRKASGRAREVVLYTYGGKAAEIWWEQNQSALRKLERLSVINLLAEQTQALAKTVSRTMQVEDLWLLVGDHSLHVTPQRRQ